VTESAKRSWDMPVFAALMVLALLAPFAIYPLFLMKVLCFALFACAFNLLIGYVGLLSFGHAMFFGFAAYISAYTVKVWGWPTELGILAGTGVAAALGVVAGLIAIRRQGIYFAMVTLALAQMVFFFCVQASFTGGEDGIQAIPRRPLLGFVDIRDDFVFYYVVLAIFAVGFLIIYRTIHSPFGQVLKAIRENEPRAISLGYAVDRFKLMAFVLSAALAGLAGATKAIVFQLASLTDVTWQMSGEVVLMTLVGGLGTVFGPIVGAGVIIAMENYLTTIEQWLAGLLRAVHAPDWLIHAIEALRLGESVPIIQGTIFVVTVLLFRRGIVGELVAFIGRWQTRGSQAELSVRPAE
jgi:branched-chain amino acid transport system permease protein